MNITYKLMEKDLMMEKPVVKISVRNLIEFILRSGDIRMGGIGPSPEIMHEGTRVHRKLQKEAPEGYKAEVRLSCQLEYENFILKIDGIADGIMISENKVTIDEIKSVSTPLDLVGHDYSPMHWAQAMCYGYMHAAQENLGQLDIRLVYYNVNTNKTKYLVKEFTLYELKAFFFDIVGRYLVWADFEVCHRNSRDCSAKSLPFPFPAFRKGQRELAVSIYKTIKNKNRQFSQAPTGTGKTVSALFPAIKALGEGFGSKIFYITAKTITRQVAEEALLRMEKKGLHIKAITLTSKDRICPQDIRSCDPESCSRACGHFDRINQAMLDILEKESIITRDILTEYSRKHNVCPFEYELDISLWVDVVICDYNYVFDPRAYLRRFFESGGDFTLLVDEAHNLVDRAREMFSAHLSKRSFMNCKTLLKAFAPGPCKAINKINKYFLTLRKNYCEDCPETTLELPKDIYPLIESFVNEMEVFLAQYKGPLPEAVITLFFEAITFLIVYRLFDYRYTAYVTSDKTDVMLRLFCIDPSGQLSKTCEKLRSSIFFSATFTPLDYFKNMLGGDSSDTAFSLPSPFERDNLCIMTANNLSTRYRDRDRSYEPVADYIHAAVSRQTGNYIVFFPSFDYMRKVYSVFTVKWPGEKTLFQTTSMSETERETFLREFSPNPVKTLTGFAVMGGIFSEGIDLPGDRLTGSVIVGVGLPQICFERDLICRYFNETMNTGFEYAYVFPGMNRVLQAAGRVIRTETDRGFVLLLDDRFLSRRYLDLFPHEWEHFIRVKTPGAVEVELETFWSGYSASLEPGES